MLQLLKDFPELQFILILIFCAILCITLDMFLYYRKQKHCSHEYLVEDCRKVYVKDFKSKLLTKKYKCDICGHITYEEID